MKKLLTMAVMMMASVCASAQSDKTPVDAYFTTAEMPDMVKFLPAPPDSTSVDFARDLHRYFWGKEMRNHPERAAMAKRDAVFSLETILTEYEEAFPGPEVLDRCTTLTYLGEEGDRLYSEAWKKVKSAN